jgi:hypothetical protein
MISYPHTHVQITARLVPKHENDDISPRKKITSINNHSHENDLLAWPKAIENSIGRIVPEGRLVILLVYYGVSL